MLKGSVRSLIEMAIEYRQQLSGLLEVSPDESNDGELAAMVSFAIAFPDGFMALVDTYDVKRYFLLCSHSCTYTRIHTYARTDNAFIVVYIFVWHTFFLFLFLPQTKNIKILNS